MPLRQRLFWWLFTKLMSAWHTEETLTARLPCRPPMTDLTALDPYLSSEQSPENAMQLGSRRLPYRRVVLPGGDHAERVASGCSRATRNRRSARIIEMILDRYNEIVDGLNDNFLSGARVLGGEGGPRHRHGLVRGLHGRAAPARTGVEAASQL